MESSLQLIRPYLREKLYPVILGIISLIIVDLLQVLIPRVIKSVVDETTTMSIGHTTLAYYALIIAAIACGMAIFRFVWRNCLLGTSRRIEEGLRNRFFSHVQNLPPYFFDKTDTGDLMARGTNDINQIRMAAGMGLVALNDTIFIGLATIGFMLFINVKLTLYVLIPMPLIALGTKFFSTKMHKLYQDVQAAFADMTEIARERFAGIGLIKAYNLQSFEQEKFGQVSGNYVRENLRLVKATGAFFPLMLFFANTSTAIVIFLGGRQTIFQEITPGDFAAFISYLGLLTWPMMALGWAINLMQRGKASLDRIHSVLSHDQQGEHPENPESIPSYTPRIRFEQVYFSYVSNSSNILEDIDLEVEWGSTLGIVGPPGSGKTTLLNLLPRLYDPTAGKITLDGQDLRNFSLFELRSLISFVSQDPFLFAGTIKDNILFGRSGVSEEEMLHAASKADFQETIRSMPGGLDTFIGEKGVILSGGQKQRLALTRAFLVPSSILLLDDPVSQVDTETARNIVGNLAGLQGEQTIFIVSHRIAPLVGADKIVTLKQGRITETGRHSELIRQDGYYSRSYRMQKIEQDLYGI